MTCVRQKLKRGKYCLKDLCHQGRLARWIRRMLFLRNCLSSYLPSILASSLIKYLHLCLRLDSSPLSEGVPLHNWLQLLSGARSYCRDNIFFEKNMMVGSQLTCCLLVSTILHAHLIRYLVSCEDIYQRIRQRHSLRYATLCFENCYWTLFRTIRTAVIFSSQPLFHDGKNGSLACFLMLLRRL